MAKQASERGVREAAVSEERRSLSSEGGRRQEAAPGRLLLLEAGQEGTDFSSGEL